MQFIQHNAKAIAAFITSLIVMPLAVFGIGAETSIADAVLILFNAAVIAAGVWFSPANR